jgi:hypothetical protein
MMGLAARNLRNARRSFEVFEGSALVDNMPFSFAETLYTAAKNSRGSFLERATVCYAWRLCAVPVSATVLTDELPAILAGERGP